MESKIQALFSTILVVTLYATTLAKPSLAQFHTLPIFPPHGSSVDLTKCFSSLFGVEGCVIQIYKSIVTGKFENVGPACCEAFRKVDEKCWPEMFPLNPFFPPLLKNGCSHISAASPTQTKPQFPIIVPGVSHPGSPVDLTKCLSSLDNVKGCVIEVHKLVFTGKFGKIGAVCCKAFMTMDEKCWPQVFPLNPFFPPLLKKECSRINGAAPAHNY